MNKTILGNLLIVLGLLFAPLAFASTVDFLPATVNVEPGKTFTVEIYINPQSITYSSKVELKYPADLLQESSFVMNDSWIALKQSGYDVTDNVNGILLKSGGYPGGFASKTLFGTVTFSAVKAGSVAISVGSNTNIPNTSNVNTLTDSPSVIVSVVEPVIVQQQTATVTEKKSETTSTTKVGGQTTTSSTQEANQQATAEDGLAEAQMASLVSVSNQSTWGWLLAIATIVLVGYVIYKKSKKK
jgi:hypothetical protein